MLNNLIESDKSSNDYIYKVIKYFLSIYPDVIPESLGSWKKNPTTENVWRNPGCIKVGIETWQF